MNDYSDLIFLMGAMIIFSMLTVQTTRVFQLNNQVQINGEIEYNAVAIAQDQIDQLRWLKHKSTFNAFESLFPKEIPVVIENDTLYYKAEIDVSNISIPDSKIENKHVIITVTNAFMKNQPGDAAGQRSVKLQFIKSFDT